MVGDGGSTWERTMREQRRRVWRSGGDGVRSGMTRIKIGLIGIYLEGEKISTIGSRSNG